ncbi:MAG: preprotein translocase subunit SecE [Deltaproteobacteria bacterium]|nr:preprotein translocase subunit SecE [Deltaproteobacteria bacterium]
MKKDKTKPKGASKEAASGGVKGQVVKLKTRKPKPSLVSRLPSVKEYWVKTKQFVIEAAQELKKVTWPSRKEALGATGVVLFLVVVISLFLGLVDFGLSRLVRTLIH